MNGHIMLTGLKLACQASEFLPLQEREHDGRIVPDRNH